MIDFDFSPVIENFGSLMHGTLITVEVVAVSMILSCTLGLLVGIGRLDTSRRLLYGICSFYVFIFRGTPLLVQLFIWYYGLPQFGISLPSFLCGVIGLGLYSASYVSEIVRGALQSVDKGQHEAARAIGMSRRVTMRLIIVPQAIVRIIPPLGNEFISLIKNSALISLVTIHDIMHEGQQIISVSYRSLEVYLAIGAVYLVLTWSVSRLLRTFENRLHTKGIQ
ncbi:amino acid ABC transporter permease [Salinicola rhizosphaerae]|uniref:ABC transporter permease n=1 Tax=Salinicola rhizosphaerae TaxID=1443141 RepID=A0ABQ3E5P5_9GAMM|nr:amino acid ABC transporter permease [Salinicola rhizosphaerae]GHB25761.1 ABC transporter permease [Salinicola rhizosphaerae]